METGADIGSPGSGPAITENKRRRSATLRAIGPTTPIQEKAPPAGGKCPVAGMRPGVGFKPQMPQKCAGTRIEPPPSLPTPPAEQPAAIAAASPPLEPPHEYSAFHGLLVLRATRLSVSYAIRNSGVVVFPSSTAPASRTLLTSAASLVGRYPRRNSEPAAHGHPATSRQLF